MNVIAVYKAQLVIDGFMLLRHGSYVAYVDRSERILLKDNSYARYWTAWNGIVVRIKPEQFDPRTHGQLELPGF